MKTIIRAEITKGEEIRYISHLDYAGAVERAIRRAGIPAAYSEGFNPHMKLAFASALAVGVTSTSEYMDVELADSYSLSHFTQLLGSALPKGIRLKRAVYKSPEDKKALMALVERASYRIVLPSGFSKDAIRKAIADFDVQDEVIVWKETPKSRKEIEIKQYMAAPIRYIEGASDELLMDILITPQGSVKPEQIVRALYDLFGFPIQVETVQIERKGLFCRRGGKWTALIQ